MNILTDILSLIRRGKFTKTASKDDVLVLGMWNEEPEMTGVASPIPYKSVKLIKVKDLASSENCDYTNTDTTSTSIGVFQKEDIDPATGKCGVFFRSLKSLNPNLTIQLSANDDYIEFDSEGEPNLAVNVGGGKQVWKDKVGETLNFRTLVEGSGITIAQSTNEITISAADNDTTYTYTSSQSGVNVDLQLTGSDGSLGNVKLLAGNNITLSDSGSNEVTINSTGGGGGGMTSFDVYDENPGGAGPGFTVTDSNDVLMWGRNGVEVITGVPLGSTSNPKSIAMGLNHYYESYVSVLSQVGTAAPTEEVKYNDLSPANSLTWTRLSAGNYRGTWATPIDSTKATFEISQTFKAGPSFANIVSVGNNWITVLCGEPSTSATEDDRLGGTILKVRIYP
jgi:hypothetical protein